MANLNQFYEEIKLKMVKPIINLENELKKSGVEEFLLDL